MSDSIWHEGLTLRSWRLQNFKSAKDTSVDLAPLTVVVGANSAGKSTLLQSIRVAAQAASSESEFFPLNGEQIRVGTFEETRFFGAKETDDPIQMGGEFHLGSPDYYDAPATYARPYGPSVRRRPRRSRDIAEDTVLDWQVVLRGAPRGQSAATNVVGVNASAKVASEPQASLRAEASESPSPVSSFGHQAQYGGEIDTPDESIPLVDLNVVGGFPRSYIYAQPLASLLFETWYDVRQEAMYARLRRNQALREERATKSDEAAATDVRETADTILADLRQVLIDLPDEILRSPTAQHSIYLRTRELYSSQRRNQDTNWTPAQFAEIYELVTHELALDDREGPRISGLPEILADAVEEAREFLATRVQHLGPLRMDPQVVYHSSPASHPGFIGAKGEYSASVLETSGTTPVQDCPRIPGTPHSRMTLQQAVNRWSTYLGVGDAFSTTDKGRLGLQLSVRQPGVNLDLDLTSVGTGVSQILPVLVMCLQAPPGSLLLVEQPELHLNPGVQQRLADFLLAVVATGRQLIVETHSDYLVTRLRRRTAEDPDGPTRDRIALVFAERHEGATTYSAVKPAADGSMTNWPRGFFDEAADDSKALLEALLGNLEK